MPARIVRTRASSGSTRTTCFGAGAAFFNSCMKAGRELGKTLHFSALQQIGSTGSPFTVENFAWLYDAIKRDVWVASISGGTDTAAGFVPNDVFAVSDIPRTLSGKKLEIPIRRLLLGHPMDKVLSPDAMANPDSVAFFLELARKLNAS